MTKFANLSRVKKTAILSGLLIVALLIAALIGYFSGLYGDGGSLERASDWAIKTDLLCILLILVSIVFGYIETYLESKWKLSFIPSYAIMLGSISAIMNGASVLLGIDSREFWTSVLDGLTWGFFCGGLGAVLIQLTDKKKLDNR